jgi:hypothetical protein
LAYEVGRPERIQPSCFRKFATLGIWIFLPSTTISPSPVSSCRMREKCSWVRLRREAMTPLLVGRVTATGLPLASRFGQFAQQVADDALLAGVQRVGFDVVHQLVQAHGHAGQHLAAQGMVACQFVEHRLLGNVQQQRVGQRLGEDDVGLFHEHDGFAEALALLQDLDDLLAALLRGEGQLDLAVDQQVEAAAGVALVEQDVAFGGVDFAGRAGDAGNSSGASPLNSGMWVSSASMLIGWWASYLIFAKKPSAWMVASPA